MRPRGGIIGASVSPSTSAASGVWQAREAEAFARSGAWPAMPGAPTGVTGSAGASQVSLTWTAPASNGGYAITDYRVQYSSDSGSNWTNFSRAVSTATSATVTGLTDGTAYTFRVAAVTFGVGPYSTASSAVTPASFTASAVLLTSGTSYTVPSGATSMKAWAVGQGGQGGGYQRFTSAGGTAYKTWSCSGGQTVSYSVGASSGGSSTTVTFSGTTITGGGGKGGTGSDFSGGTFSGGDGGANGGAGGSYTFKAGAVGGNTTACTNRNAMTDVSGLKAAVALAGGKTVEDCGSTPAFGSGGGWDKTSASTYKTSGFGGGIVTNPNNATSTAPSGAVVLYFT